jgi:ethanolamine utilization protein EutN
MQLGRVIGTVVATRKDDSLVGYKLLVVEMLEAGTDKAGGRRLVAVDTLGAGERDIVLFAVGGAARIKLPAPTPVDAAIVGIVDSVDVRK